MDADDPELLFGDSPDAESPGRVFDLVDDSADAEFPGHVSDPGHDACDAEPPGRDFSDLEDAAADAESPRRFSDVGLSDLDDADGVDESGRPRANTSTALPASAVHHGQ